MLNDFLLVNWQNTLQILLTYIKVKIILEGSDF